MNVRPYIRRYCPTIDDLASQAGLSYGYLKHLAKLKPRSAGREARLLLARAFRAHAEQLKRDADAIESGL